MLKIMRACLLMLLGCRLLMGSLPAWGGTTSATEPTLTLSGDPGGPTLVIQGVLDPDIMHTILVAFHQRYPAMTLRYIDVSGRPNRSATGTARGFTPDLTMSSAMPWQYLRANNGHAMSLGEHTLPDDWPVASRWRNELVGLTAEPLVIVYRREYAQRFGVPRDHATLLQQLRQHRQALDGRVVTYDPACSDTGFTYLAEDARQSVQIWSLVAALGAAHAELTDSTGAMLEGLLSGRYLVGYNLIGSYAMRLARHHPELVVQVPEDYALIMQRLALIPRNAPHPDHARRFLHFLTSHEGQKLLAQKTALGTLRPADKPGNDMNVADHAAHFIRPGPGLLALVDPLKRSSLLARWQQSFNPSPRNDQRSRKTLCKDPASP
ncbi:ABC transporter substrate-binding protein [Kushneria phosphatilytica]|nr:extracellular solute-binding protein [Kushneria phosphatilytica]OHV10264.1 hypothetical protein BH688_09710 [Kushneria phosphatilytica]